MKKVTFAFALVAITTLALGVRAWAAPEGHGGGASAGSHAEGKAEHGKEGEGKGHESEEAEEAAAPGSINWTDGMFGGNSHQPPLGALLVNFGLLVFIYVRFGKQPIADALKERRTTIAKDIEQAAKILGEAKGRAKVYQAKLAQKDDDAEVAKTGLIEAGKTEKERIVQEAEEKAARLKRDAAFLMEQEVKQLKVDLVKETVEKAIAEAESMLKRGVTQADQERLAEEYLATLGQAPGGSR